MSRRPPSPSTTSYSGISNYRADSFRPVRDMAGSSREGVPGVPQIDSRIVARAHYDELRAFLSSHLATEPLNSRSSAREKLTRLTKQQFQELSTDVYDELMRRNNNSEDNEVPFLPVREDFHPKRNQARQKLATLPKTRFKDLSSDVFYELGRRYPEFKEEEVPPETPQSEYSEAPPPPEPVRRPSQESNNQFSTDRRKASQDPVIGYSNDRRKPSQEANNSFAQPPNRRPSADTYGSSTLNSRLEDGPTRRPSEDTVRLYQRKTSQDTSTSGHSLYRKPSQDGGSMFSTATTPSTATSGVVIPTKSTIAEEEIQVPYGRDDDDSRRDSASEGGGETTSTKRAEGLGALGATLMSSIPLSPMTDEEGAMERKGGNRETGDFYDKMSFGRASVSSSIGGGHVGREAREEAEKMRSEYEYKIATMQKRINTLESEVSQNRNSSDVGKVDALTKELQTLQARTDEQAAVIRNLQRNLEQAQSGRAEEEQTRHQESQRREQNEAELRQLQDRIEELESERYNSTQNSFNGQELDDMRNEIQNLVDELKDLALRNEELSSEKDADQATIENLNHQVKDYKRKYEQAKTELRNVKATSQLFLQQTPKAEDQLPVAENGAILDIHVTAFQSATDSLLMVARSSAPSSVLTSMRAIVTAVSSIIDDLRNFEQRPPRERLGVDDETLNALRERADATLSNLAIAAKNHAMGNGLSPVSLVDAAASHVSASVVAIIKSVMMRKSTAAERERDRLNAASGASSPALNGKGYAPTLRSVDEIRMAERHGRAPSDSSQWSNGGRGGDGDYRKADRRAFSDASSNPSPQPPPIFDTPHMTGNSEEGSDEAWEELKPYLDAQSESIVLPIRNLLSSIRNGAPPAELNDNLTQIITIVSSIVAVCKDSLPSANAQLGEEIIQQLSDHCNKLSELQSEPEITKQTRQAMAASSFAVAKAMKELRAMA